MSIETEIMKVMLGIQNTPGYVLDIKLSDIGKIADAEREEMTELLKRCEKQVGTHLGEEINAMVARVEGRRFNERDYHYERHPEGQK